MFTLRNETDVNQLYNIVSNIM